MRAVGDHPIGSYADFEDITEISGSTISNWRNRGDDPPPDGIVEKAGEFYMLMAAGQRALEFSWRDYLD